MFISYFIRVFISVDFRKLLFSMNKIYFLKKESNKSEKVSKKAVTNARLDEYLIKRQYSTIFWKIFRLQSLIILLFVASVASL